MAKTTGVVMDISKECEGSIRKIMEGAYPYHFNWSDEDAARTASKIDHSF